MNPRYKKTSSHAIKHITSNTNNIKMGFSKIIINLQNQILYMG
jgi:hypothetical protein